MSKYDDLLKPFVTSIHVKSIGGKSRYAQFKKDLGECFETHTLKVCFDYENENPNITVLFNETNREVNPMRYTTPITIIARAVEVGFDGKILAYSLRPFGRKIPLPIGHETVVTRGNLKKVLSMIASFSAIVYQSETVYSTLSNYCEERKSIIKDVSFESPLKAIESIIFS